MADKQLRSDVSGTEPPLESGVMTPDPPFSPARCIVPPCEQEWSMWSHLIDMLFHFVNRDTELHTNSSLETDACLWSDYVVRAGPQTKASLFSQDKTQRFSSETGNRVSVAPLDDRIRFKQWRLNLLFVYTKRSFLCREEDGLLVYDAL